MDRQTSPSSITRQLQTVFAISIIILLISSIASFMSNKKLIDSSYLVNHTNEVVVESEKMMASIRDAVANQRGYIITNNKIFLQDYNDGYEQTISNYEKLRSLTIDNPKQQRNLDDAKVLIDRRYAQMQTVVSKVENLSLAQRAALFQEDDRLMMTGKIIMDELRTVTDRIKAEEATLLKARLDEQELYTTYTPILILIAAALSIAISVAAYVRIKNDLDQRMRKQKEDEQKYIDTNNRITVMETVTKKLASGDFAARSEDKGEDDLGRISDALNEMARALEHNFNKLEEANWQQTGAMNISNAIRGERYLKNVADNAISSLATYVAAPVGTLYVVDQDMNLKLAGSYGASGAPIEIPAGHGLMAQAIAEKRIIQVNNIPQDYIKVNSSIGNTSPKQLLIAPLTYGYEMIGVMELAMLDNADETELQFVNNNTEAIAIAISAAINYDRMQNLLEETQAQAEELQTQHGELENINTELEAQAEKLQASEEELKVQQEELQQANVELEERSRLLEESYQKIAEQNVEVKRKADELALTTKYKSEFLANMSHELRTPLNSILLLSRLLSENSDKNLSKDQVEYANVILSSGNGLLSLIDEILDLSKIEAGKMSLEFQRTLLNEVRSDMRVLFEPVANDKNLTFTFNIDSHTPDVIETDKMRLEQVIKNLVSNAIKFTSRGGVTVTVQRNESNNKLIDIAVTDTGIGIAEDKQKLIFEAFQQADGSTRRKYGGTGLGLSISKELAKLLGGDIKLESKAGEGSTFTITIPILQEDRIVAENILDEIPEKTNAVSEKKERTEQYISTVIPESIPDDRAYIMSSDKAILIIEDDVNFAKSLLEYTRSKGYKGIVAVRGDEGVELAKQYLPTGILLDIQLPVMSGWEVMEQLKGDATTRHIPVHIMSSYEVKKESLMKGAINFINKPVAYEQIHQVFEKLEYVLNRESKKVLIVEENPKHAKALAYFLETFNINSEIKHNVSDSVDALKGVVDCVILDMGIPDQHAYDTLEEMKKDPELEHLPIIVFTGKSLSLKEEQKIKQYADSIVVKTAHSYQRILDEISIFLHLMEETKSKPQKESYRKLGMLNDVLKDKSILIVDDDVRNIFSLTKALEKMDMKVIAAVDGREAMQKLEENAHIDLVLLDMMMPEMDGYETATAIRNNKKWKNLPVIAVTAKAMTGDRDKCIKAGASDYISKPVDIDQLLSLLRVWLYEKV